MYAVEFKTNTFYLYAARVMPTPVVTLLREPLLLVVLMLLLGGCGSIERQWPGLSEPDSASYEDLGALFSQPYIDPLTRYLETNHNNPTLTDELQRVRLERDRRCGVIADNYAKQEVTSQSVERFRRGYAYSCPQDVQAYAEQLELKEPAQPSLHPLASECYLLTSIKNYAEAIRVCNAPAESGDLRAQTNLAIIHYELKRYEQALEWAKLAADTSAEAAFLLGKLYEQGQGVTSDSREALNWYQRAQQMGHTQADAEFLRLSNEMQ